MTPQEISDFVFENWTPRVYPDPWKLWRACVRILAHERRRGFVPRESRWLAQLYVEFDRGFRAAGVFPDDGQED